ncbi:MAG: REP-associated tyrosine transposase [Bacteroidia bacterium]
MSEKYKTYEGGLFFVTLTVVGWIDVFTRSEYCDEIIKNLNFCIEKKGLHVYAFVIMSNHLHLIASVDQGLLSAVLRDFKSFTAKSIINMINENPQESRKEWLLYMFEYFAKGNKHNSQYQFWQHNNHPIDLVSNKFIDQRVNYIHENPVKANLVNETQNYIYSSANPFTTLRLEAL